MQWTQITVLTTTEGSELVSAVLMDAGSAGVMIEDKNDVEKNQRPAGQWDIIDEAIARRIGEDVKVTGYYPVDDRLVETVKIIREKISGLPANAPEVPLGKLKILSDTIDEEDWAESWKNDFKPFRLGRHIVIKPSWSEYEILPADKVIEIDPGMAFGTGTHETTGMCVKLVEKYVRPDMRAIDLGTGTGILAIAAAHMGAKDVLAIDLDPVAVRVAAENVRRNGFAGTIRVREGDLLARVDEVADVVVANIIADVIIHLCGPVQKHILPGGTFICSGIAREKKAAVIEALEAARYTDLEVLDEGEWTAIACKRP